jgi:hypothetical protein
VLVKKLKVCTPNTPHSQVGLGVHVGTAQSRSFYGGCNSSRVFAFQTPGPDGRQREIGASPFNALLAAVVTARGACRCPPLVVLDGNSPYYAVPRLFFFFCVCVFFFFFFFFFFSPD